MGRPLVECRCGFARGQLLCLATQVNRFNCPFCQIFDVGESTFLSFVQLDDIGNQQYVNAVGRKCKECGFVIMCCRQHQKHDSSAPIY